MYVNHSEKKKHGHVHCGTPGSPLVFLLILVRRGVHKLKVGLHGFNMVSNA